MQRNCNLCNFIFLNIEINCQSKNANLMDHSQKSPIKILLSKKLLFSDTNWLEQNFIHVEKCMQKHRTEHCQDLLRTCNFLLEGHLLQFKFSHIQ